jgi:hypothetical protein
MRRGVRVSRGLVVSIASMAMAASIVVGRGSFGRQW